MRVHLSTALFASWAVFATFAACGGDGDGDGGDDSADGAGDTGDTGDDDGGGDGLFEEQPECEGQAIVPFEGQQQMVISTIAIGSAADGFDLDGDGEPDNQLAGIAGIAGDAIADSFAAFDIIAPIEFFDFEDPAADECVKFAVYLGSYKLDGDGDGETTAAAGGDCNDLEATIARGAAEVAGNFIDDDCDGLADDVDGVPSTDTEDRDADGVAIADGDCDDTRPEVTGAAEVCGDGLDNDCDGNADFALNGDETPFCTPYDQDTPDLLPVDPASLDGDGAPIIAFTSGTVSDEGGTLVLEAGPALFNINVPITDGVNLDLRITGAQVRADVVMTPAGWALSGGRLGGVIDAATADQIRGLEVEQIGLNPEDSLLDAIFANVLAAFLGLPKATGTDYPDCHVPDVDVDQDGVEIFCDSNPDDDVNTVDTCIDGDGTVVTDQGTGDAIVNCTEAEDDDGEPRFVDGISIELNFDTVPAQIAAPLP
jgi:Putative metal-binding motif